MPDIRGSNFRLLRFRRRLKLGRPGWRPIAPLPDSDNQLCRVPSPHGSSFKNHISLSVMRFVHLQCAACQLDFTLIHVGYDRMTQITRTAWAKRCCGANATEPGRCEHLKRAVWESSPDAQDASIRPVEE